MRSTRLVTLLACAFGIAYLLLRLTTLGTGWILGLSVALLATEIAAFTQFGLFAFTAWHAPEGRNVFAADRSSGPVDVVVDARGSDVTALERTLIGASDMAAVGTLSVVDIAHHADIARLVESFDGNYVVDARLEVEPAATLFDASEGEFYAWLEAGQVPMPDLLTAGRQRFADQSMAVWQSAIGLLNEDSLVHIQRGRDEDAVYREVIAPGLDHLGVAPWFGPGSMIRRDAILMLGGFTDGGTAAVSRTLVRLHQRGWTSAFSETPHVRSIAPDDLDDYLVSRRLRAVAALGIFATRENPLLTKELSLTQRLSHLVSASMFFTGLRQLLLVIVMIATLVIGRLPIEAPLGPLLLLWAIPALLTALARRLLARGSMRFGDWTRQGWRTLGADLAGIAEVFRTSARADEPRRRAVTGLRTLGRLRTLTAIVVALDVALLLRGATLLNGSLLTNFTGAERVLVISFSLFTLIPMVDVLQLVVTRRQRRKTFRLEAELDVRVGDTVARTVDLATSGIGVLLPYSPEIGSVVDLTLQIPDLSGVERPVAAQSIVRAATIDPTGLVRVGFEFDQLTDVARRALIEYCMIGRDPAASPAHVAEPHSLSIDRPHLHRVHSLRALTAMATAASLLVLFAGPSPVSAAENAETYGLYVLNTDGSAVEDAFVRYHEDGWREVGATNVDGLAKFTVPSESVALEVVFAGGRYVTEIDRGESNIVLPRIDASGVLVDVIDAGSGWMPFVDGMHVVPGRLVIRLQDGSIIKTTLDEGSALDLKTGSQTLIVPPSETTTIPETTTTTTAVPETKPETTTTATAVPETKPETTTTTTAVPETKPETTTISKSDPS